MSTPQENPASPEPTVDGKPARSRPYRRRGLKWLLFAGLPVFALMAVFVPRAFARGGWGFGHGGGCGMHGRGGPESVEKVREHMGYRAEHLLDRVDATDAQRKQVNNVLDAFAPEVFAFRNEAHALRKSFKQVIAQEPIDAAKLDQLREQGLALASKASDRALDTMLEVSNVLTVEQRAKVRKDLERWSRWDEE